MSMLQLRLDGGLTMKRKVLVTTKDLEDAYREILEVDVERVPTESMDLRQPRISKVVRTVTTYGAYEEPL